MIKHDAIGRVRAACRVLTPEQVDVVSWAVVNGASLDAYERRLRLPAGVGAARLGSALLALWEHYGMRPRPGFAALRTRSSVPD